MNIFNKILAIALTVAAIEAATVNAASVNVGYSYGEIAETGISKVGKGVISGAIQLPAELLDRYVGGKVVGIKVGLVTADGITDLVGWIRNDLTGENLTFGEASAIAEGWNEIPLDGSLTIDGSPLMVGFSFNQEKGVKCISLVGDDVRQEAKWIAKNDNWAVSDKTGVLSLEMVVSGDNFSASDLWMQKIVGPEMPVSVDGDIQLKGIVRNIGTETVNEFNVEYSIDGSVKSVIPYRESLQYGETAEILLTVNGDEITPDESHNLELKVLYPNDNFNDNDSLVQKIGFYTQSFPHRVLVEEFTSEECVNCPRAIMALEQCINAGYGDSMSIVAHHVGYKQDWLTIKEDYAYSDFFDIHSAPSGMLDRRLVGSETNPVFAIGNFSQFGPLVEEAMARPSFVSLNVNPSVADGELTVQVDIRRLPIFEATCQHPRLTVYAVESGILHHNQAGIESDTFTHSHVMRRHLTDEWGDEIDWNGDSASLTVTCNIDEEWNLENMEVVAFVNEYDSMSVFDCKVHNSAIAPITISSVDMLDYDGEVVEVSYYSLDGLELPEAPSKGLCVSKTVFSNGNVKYQKILI